MTLDPTIKTYFESVNSSANAGIDNLIRLRQDAEQKEKYYYRYLIKKLEVIVGASNRALDKINQMDVSFKLEDIK